MPRHIPALALLVVLAACRTEEVKVGPIETATPAYVTAVDAAIPTASIPATEPDKWLLAHLDVETTGLVAGYHEIIDAGFVITDLDGNVLDSLYIRIQPEHPERLSTGAAKVNGFDAAKWQQLGALTTKQAVDTIIAFNQRAAGDKHVLLVAFNSQFDAGFLDALMHREGHAWRELFHYFVLDIPSMAWSLGYRDLTGAALARQLKLTDEPRVAEDHTGITGAMLNVRIYKALRALGAKR
ncbi:MAG: 3'-5' exonuclease [Gemmatimonadaceae bacterium]|jgi:DNA polymerase III alpha subunit (gram-positive type)